MTKKELEKLEIGDLVSHKMTGNSYVVIVTWPIVLAVRSVKVTNPTEWNKVRVSSKT